MLTRSHISILLLILFSSFSVLRGVHLVNFHHHEEEIICTEESESDACHLTLVHGDDEGCEHPEHIQESKSLCELCDAVVIKTAYLVDINLTTYSEDIIAFDERVESQQAHTKSEPCNPLRGPPSVS